MKRNYILIPGLLLLGIAAGAVFMHERADTSLQRDAAPSQQPARSPVVTQEHPMAETFAVVSVSDSERIDMLEQQVHTLQSRIVQLERSIQDEPDEDEAQTTAALPFTGQSTVDTPVSNLNPAVTTDNLTKAGIDADLAADIVRRRNEVDMKLLELRDRAAREGFYGTERYMDAVSELRAQSPSLRDEIGDDSYDSYLFASRQANRVRAVSVMMGSPAEMAGMQEGDLILSYDGRKMFDYSELQEATSRGERGEYVNVTVLRNGQLHNLWVPRGPLGIRLGSVRMRP